MKAICLHSTDEIEAVLRRHPFLHLYEIGDLDNFFWDYTIWYALQSSRAIEQIALVYTGLPLPTLIGLSAEPIDDMRELLQAILHLLPRRIYAHLSPGLAPLFADTYQLTAYGEHYKMALTDYSRLHLIDTTAVVPLSIADAGDLQALYQESYPGNWFDPRMLETGCYYGLRRGDALISVAGIHVYSPRYRVAALGNITTHPNARGQGLATMVCAKLCGALLEHVDHIGLNVKADNTSAIACYQNLGFEIIGRYEEYLLDPLEGRA